MDFSFFTPLLAGILASFTPCVIVLFPITLYRFISAEKVNFKDYGLYAAGFLFAFVLLGLFFQKIFESEIGNGIKLGIAISLIVLGILQLLHKVNPLNLPVVKNTFTFGMLFALAIGINPCTLPFIGSVFAFSSGEILLNLTLFGIGILVAPTLFLLFGRKFLAYGKNFSSQLGRIEKFLAVLLILAGLYMGWNMLTLTTTDVIVSSLFILFIILLILKIFLIEHSFKELLTIPRLLLIISLLIIWFVITYHCYGSVEVGMQKAVCSMSCYICQRCLILFGISAVIGIAGVLILNKFEKKNKK
ncbi:putative cytochrome c biogenesis protein [groundwater metagenome]|uniref:Putative cytochrome c biogenesis protein n=1 Tax=groundwater metagenome TaxID=717931 RepID=A0A098ED67_9ZZZZ